MDGDLQDVPEAIPQFVERSSRATTSFMPANPSQGTLALRLCYFVFYRMMASLSDLRLPLDSGDFGLMSRRVVDQVRRMPEHHRYLARHAELGLVSGRRDCRSTRRTPRGQK